ncbi:hypothetical protein BB934_35740 (plasmid) [Microvirga ossetica]|uniref:Uncharacterized protein n=1 Tax=Microvirga ossetica TaxID=1882682 RepID=A0A1B2EUG3_9HYPH|nr:hypothetical protein [Microvirga ossetica]ANY83610.1 hypothetical protein BB934_35740 [Microvirga ossetica]
MTCGGRAEEFGRSTHDGTTLDLRAVGIVAGARHVSGLRKLSRLRPEGARGKTSDLAKAAQNPIADMISVPFQNNFNFHVGPHDQLQDILNIQPVIPITLDRDWNLITRWITPVISQPPLTVAAGDERVQDPWR